MTFPSIVLLGAGQMSEALIRGVLNAGLVKPAEIMATDVRADRLAELSNQLGIRTSTDNRAAISFGRVIVIAVKPQDVPGLLTSVGPLIGPEQMLVSIAAGVTTTTLESGLRGKIPVVRVMPNTPALVGAGMAAVALGRHATTEDGEVVAQLMSAAGQAVILPEKHLDAVTALSGSGPAFVALFIEGLVDGGVRVGLARDVAMTLAIQTVLGTAQMMQTTGLHPGVLKDMVTSPGGTSIAGVHALERGGMRAALIDAVVAATERSQQLGQG